MEEEEKETLRKKAILVEKLSGPMVKVVSESSDLSAVYLSSRGSAAKEETFRNVGIRCIVNVSNSVPFYFSEEEEMSKFDCVIKKYRVAIEDEEQANLLDHLESTTEFIHQCRKNQLPVLVHCSMGVSRSPSMIIAYLIRFENMSLVKAFEHTQNIRDSILPNMGFFQQLEIWEQKWRSETTLQQLAFFHKVQEKSVEHSSNAKCITM